MKILVVGLTSTSMGGMESRNLGNYIIVEPLFSHLRRHFPSSEICTSLQLSPSFCDRFGVVSLGEKRFWTYGKKAGWATIKDFFRLLLWMGTRRSRFLTRSPLLYELTTANIVIDFSGDVYGDNAKWNKFLEANAKLLFALLLRKPVAMVVGSPGPFTSIWRLSIAKSILRRLDLVTNREPLSTWMLSFVGIDGSNVVTTACPSVLFEKADKERLRSKEDYSNVFESEEQTLGIILCGWNMPTGPYHRWPRDEWEFEPFLELIEYLLRKTRYRVCLMSHQNGTDSKGLLTRGTDHRIIGRLMSLCQRRFADSRVFTLADLYDAAESKAIISSFELLVSGRIHGAVQALSQGIPTMILDYGHEPKAHKLRGFARAYGVDDLVVSPRDSAAMIDRMTQLIGRKDAERLRLLQRVGELKKLALSNFELLSKLVQDNRCTEAH